ncbi:MAG: phosphotransferase [Thermoleophilaceae bacterium]|nr:phosphotransferase [Thermoleophilaceae bacterium]
MTSSSPLELLHPAGQVERVLVLGERCPPALLPRRATRAVENADLAVIAPSPAELGQSGWLERATLDVAGGLAEHGVAYALLPRRSRAEGRRQLRRAGLVLEPPLVHLPGAGVPRYLLPLQAKPWRYTLARQIGARPRIRRGLVATRALPFGSSLLVRALPTVGIVARPPGAEPLAAWVGRLGGETRAPAHAVVATSWRGPDGPTVLHCFAAGDERPWGVAKVAPESSREARVLEQLGDAARGAGARVPRLLADGRVADCPVLIETVLEGQPAADVLMRSPGSFAEVVGAIADWQGCWNRESAVPGTRLQEEVLAPATELEGKLPDGYRSWLAARCSALASSELVLVARHNDLTMWNVLLDGRGSIGVLDWAEAEDAGLPLTDFFYSVADAAAACDRYRDRLAAIQTCFSPGGAYADEVAGLQERLRAPLKLPVEALELCFHACWLRHACNEQRSANASDGPFLAIARWLARRALETA